MADSLANTKARCAGCKQYRPRAELTKVGLSSICSDNDDCRRAVLDKTKIKVRAKATRTVAKKKSCLELPLRKEIHSRDKTCRFCGQTAYRMEVHHINYRSQGGPDVNWNLILLCDEHHRLVHSNKKRWQPILRAYIWLYYVEGKREWAISKVEGALRARGTLA